MNDINCNRSLTKSNQNSRSLAKWVMNIAFLRPKNNPLRSFQSTSHRNLIKILAAALHSISLPAVRVN